MSNPSTNKEQWLGDLERLLTEDLEHSKTEKQARIVEAAIEIFSEKGFAAASTSEIAQKAGVAEATIFRHYKTKKDLLLSIAGPILVKLVAPFLIRDFAKLIELPYDTPEDFLRAIVRDRFQFARNNQKLLKILFHEIPFQPELLEQVKNIMTEIVVVRIHKVIRHFQAQGHLIDAPPWRLMRAAVSMMAGMIIFHVFIHPDPEFDEEEEIEHTIDMLLNGIGRGARS